jgi:hypothetical protein
MTLYTQGFKKVVEGYWLVEADNPEQAQEKFCKGEYEESQDYVEIQDQDNKWVED